MNIRSLWVKMVNCIKFMLKHFTDEALIAEMESRGLMVSTPILQDQDKSQWVYMTPVFERSYHNEDQPELTGLREHGGA